MSEEQPWISQWLKHWTFTPSPRQTLGSTPVPLEPVWVSGGVGKGTRPKLLPFWDTRLQKYHARPWNLDQGSLKVIETGTIQQIHNAFQLVLYRKSALKTHCFWDIHLRKTPWNTIHVSASVQDDDDWFIVQWSTTGCKGCTNNTNIHPHSPQKRKNTSTWCVWIQITNMIHKRW